MPRWSPAGWIGLNRIYAGRQVLTHTKRRFIPYLMPQIDTIFSFAHALEEPENAMPLFYVDYSVAAPYLGDSSAREIHLLRLKPLGKERDLATTSGALVFAFKPAYPSRSAIPLKVDTLSRTVLTIQPERPLEDGEYLVVMGPLASNGFEFRIDCRQDESAILPRINVENPH